MRGEPPRHERRHRTLSAASQFQLHRTKSAPRRAAADDARRYLGLSDLGIYGLLVGATNIVPAILGFGMTDWVMRKIVDLPSSQALPLIASRLGLTLSIHLIVQPLALAANILLGEPIPRRIAVLCGAILMLENLGTEAAAC